MFLIDAIKHNVKKKLKTCFIFLRDCLGEVGISQAYKKKTVLFLFMLCFYGVKKRKDKIHYNFSIN